MKYEHYTALDFVKNENFQNWVKNPDEKSDFYWESWMRNHGDKKYLVMEAREILTSINFPTESAPQALMDDVLEKVLKGERPLVMQKNELQQRSMHSFKIKKTLAIAASIIIISIVGFVLFDLDKNMPDKNKTTFLKEIIKENPSGRKTTFHLSDGSLIKLNASSKLVVSDSFGIEKRAVYLEGEAFFEISKDSKKPFIVYTGNVATIVTGTAFNVRAYHDDESINVAVFEGNVKTILYDERGCDTLTLHKSDMATFDKSTSKLSKTSFDYLEVMGWKDGIIYFKNAKSKEAFNYLERWYGVDIQVINGDKILGSFYGEFKNENLKNVLTAMGKALQFDYQFNDNFVFIKPKNIKNE